MVLVLYKIVTPNRTAIYLLRLKHFAIVCIARVPGMYSVFTRARNPSKTCFLVCGIA